MRVILLGFDGADWGKVCELMENGKLLNFKMLGKNGTALPLKSTVPPLSPPAWASIVTGVNPGKHGVYEFVEFDKETFQKIVRFNPIRAKKIWEYLDENGYRSIIINFPLMYPPEKINGITVSGLLTPSSAKYFTYPKSFTNKLKKLGYEIELSEIEIFKLLYSNKNKLYFRLIQLMRKRARISLQLLLQEKWDFSMIVFNEADKIQHFFLNESKKIERCYEEMDRILGLFMRKISDEKTVIMVVSDHGFRKVEKYFYINSWLLKKGLLNFKKVKYKGMREMVLQLLDKLHFGKVLGCVPNILRKMFPSSYISEVNIDRNKTRVYCISGYGYLALNGSWSFSEKQRLKDELLSIVDFDGGKKVIKRVLEKEKIYKGKYLEDAPELVLIPNEGYFFQDKYLSKKLFDKPENTVGLAKRVGEHSDFGILFSNFPNSRKRKICKVYDIVPTLFSIYGLNKFNRKYFDGKSI